VVCELFWRDEQKYVAVRRAGANGEGINTSTECPLNSPEQTRPILFRQFVFPNPNNTPALRTQNPSKTNKSRILFLEIFSSQ
jgi:hypothetical protein